MNCKDGKLKDCCISWQLYRGTEENYQKPQVMYQATGFSTSTL